MGDEKVRTTGKVLRLMKRNNCGDCLTCHRVGSVARVMYSGQPGAYISVGGYDASGAWYHMTVDHKIPTARGGENRMHNLAVMCNLCNNLKGAKTLEEFRGIMEPRKDTGENHNE